ncbi:MAG: DmsC/YnfH family molybdoenzyme membrane anchor subunit [Acidimicrobiales bacterium]
MSLLSAVALPNDTPVDLYLSQQADLSAVERFAQRQGAELVPLQARYYRDLIPFARPRPGEQYGFEVDLDACTGCKACVAACHSLNGLDEGESWRSVTLLRGGAPNRPFQQTVTGACHHCIDPACMKGCPVDAYEKDPVTGVVSHLDDQCIGCRYCTLTCPYEVPVYNGRRGIVRKCDMCQDRLVAGEAPACVQACPNSAIRVTIVDMATTCAAAPGNSLVPGAPPSSITVPTTVYRTATGRIHELPVANQSSRAPAHAHLPLTVMLVLTQLSVGAFVIDLLLRYLSVQGTSGARSTVDAAVAVASGLVALAASVLHLGRPRYCYRAIIGFRHSWLSREAVAFGAFTPLASLYALVLWFGAPIGGPWLAGLGGLAAGCGLAGVGCSVLIYTTTRRSSWRIEAVTAKFGLTAAMCGSAAVAWASLVSGNPTTARILLVVLVGVTAVKLGGESMVFRHRRHPGHGERDQRGRLMLRDLRTNTAWRYAVGTVAGVILPLVTLGSIASNGRATVVVATLATAVLGGTVAGELLERSLFFTTASSPR